MSDELTVTIDGQEIRVAEGTTILAAARRLGIEVPTLCHVEGFEPVSSCFLCAVQIEGRPFLSPACAMPVAPGMVIDCSGPDVREARKMALELLLSDHAGDCIAPCRATCPADLDIPGFVYEIASGRSRQSMEVISRRLALPGALGRICPRLCERECRRDSFDTGLSIGALHRFAADQDLSTGDPYLPPQKQSQAQAVAIIGAGPAGLAAAYYLLQEGYSCTLFDAQAQAGGMLRYGIPEFRMPREALDAEIELIRKLGAEFRMNCRWGVGFTLSDLRREFDAVFVGIGAQSAQRLDCEGSELALSGVDFLNQVARGEVPDIGEQALVVGGGNTAMDVSRTAIRLGARKVQVLYRRSRQEMPCLLEEVEAAELEGVRIENLVSPVRIKNPQNGSLLITCRRMTLGEPDSSGRRRPLPVAGSEFDLQASAVIAAVGQQVDCRPAIADGLEVTPWGIRVDRQTLRTNLEGVFAGGDAVSGADLAVRAVAAGRLAAVSIDQYLRREPVVGTQESMHILMRGLEDDEMAAIFRNIERQARPAAREIDLERRRTSFAEIASGLSPREAVDEARRCMSCSCRKAEGCRLRQYGTEYGADPYRFRGQRRRFSQETTHPEIIYERGKCILCNACVHVTEQGREELGLGIIGRGFEVAIGVPFRADLAKGVRHTARQCAEVCPTGALALRSNRACDLCQSCSM